MYSRLLYLSFSLLLCDLAVAASYKCIDFDVPMSFSAPSLPPNFPEFQNQIEAVQFLNAITTRGTLTSGPPPFGAAKNISVDVTVATHYCYPATGNSSVVQLLTHGIGFDHSYWDFGGAESEYNYIKAATEAGYATLSYDRIGTGRSTKTDPYTTQQLGVEAGVLATLTVLLREGAISKYAGTAISTPSKVVHVGHSFGSAITNAVIATLPTMSDGAILTGFSTSAEYGLQFAISSNFYIASEHDPQRFGDYNFSKGYLTWGDALSNQYSFFHAPGFDPKVLYQAEAGKQPFAISEPLQAIATMAPAFAGPVLVRQT